MWSRSTSLVPLVAFATVVAACGGGVADGPTSTSAIAPSSPPASQAGPTSSAGPVVTESPDPRYVVPEVGEIQSVSSDGSMLVVSDGRQICVQPIDGPSARCVAWRPGAAESGVQLVGGWSPDGATYVFFDRLFAARTFRSPVWALDIESTELTELHDGDEMVAFDVAVDPDSGGFVVAGSGIGGGSGVVAVDGERRLPVTSAEFDAIELVDDGSGLLGSSLGSADEGGVWWVGRDDGALTQVLEPDPELGLVTLAGSDGEGEWALVYYREFVARRGMPPDVSHFGLLEVDTGALTPVADEAGATFVGPLVATLSSDGQAVGYINRDGFDVAAPLVVARRPTGKGPEEVIVADVFDEVGPPPTSDRFFADRGLRPVLTPGGRMVFPTRGWALVLQAPAS